MLNRIATSFLSIITTCQLAVGADQKPSEVWGPIQSISSEQGTQEYQLRGGVPVHRIAGSRWGNEFGDVNAQAQAPLIGAVQMLAVAEAHHNGVVILNIPIGPGEQGAVHFLALTSDGKLRHARRSPDGSWLGWGDVNAEIPRLGKIVSIDEAGQAFEDCGTSVVWVCRGEHGETINVAGSPYRGWSVNQFSLPSQHKPAPFANPFQRYRFRWICEALDGNGRIVATHEFVNEGHVFDIGGFTNNHLVAWTDELSAKGISYVSKRARLIEQTPVEE